ncbi:MAG: C4-type zinc ribbon domain-containing protein [Candidatus Omnitrophica bacterium]|nr:C4-type zinc ribbon domain-containing protein [Candidatus Omnitrophota bacterium]MDD5672111.1 C4-type zinc ribbon domain-containing protein [Candidatus Omnitrophota bacterium]
MDQIRESIKIMEKAAEFDSQLYVAFEQLKEIPQMRSKNKATLDSEKTHLAELEAALKKLLLAQKEKEGALAQKEGNVKKLDGQLGQVKTNKEYSALQQEIASLKADNSLLEEEIIKIFDEVEAAQTEVKKEQERLKQCEKDYQGREHELDLKEKEMKDTENKFRQQREDIVNQLKPDIKSLYERILAKKQGVALVKIKGDMCPACQMQLRPQMVNEIYLGESLVICDNCSRILYADETLKE